MCIFNHLKIIKYNLVFNNATIISLAFPRKHGCRPSRMCTELCSHLPHAAWSAVVSSLVFIFSKAKNALELVGEPDITCMKLIGRV